MAKSIRAIMDEAREHDDYYEHWIVSDFTEELCRRMAVRGLNGKGLAEAIGTSPAYVSRVLSGKENLTAKTMAKLGRAVGSIVRVHLSAIGAYTVWIDVPGGPSSHVPSSNVSGVVNFGDGDQMMVAAGTQAGDSVVLRY